MVSKITSDPLKPTTGSFYDPTKNQYQGPVASEVYEDGQLVGVLRRTEPASSEQVSLYQAIIMKSREGDDVTFQDTKVQDVAKNSLSQLPT